MDKDVKVKPVNHCSLNICNRNGKPIATAPQVDGLFVLKRALESTEYTDIDESCLLALMTTGRASRHDAEKRMLWHRPLAHVSVKALGTFLTITDAPRMTWKCDCTCCIKCKLARKTFTLNTTFHASEPLQLVHSDLCGPLEAAIGGASYMLRFIHNAMRRPDEYTFMFKSQALD